MPSMLISNAYLLACVMNALNGMGACDWEGSPEDRGSALAKMKNHANEFRGKMSGGPRANKTRLSVRLDVGLLRCILHIQLPSSMPSLLSPSARLYY